MKTHTKKELDKLTCNKETCQCLEDNCEKDNPIGKGFYVHSACHVDSPTWAYYNKAEGAIIMYCSTCNKFIIKIKVGE